MIQTEKRLHCTGPKIHGETQGHPGAYGIYDLRLYVTYQVALSATLTQVFQEYHPP